MGNNKPNAANHDSKHSPGRQYVRPLDVPQKLIEQSIRATEDKQCTHIENDRIALYDPYLLQVTTMKKVC